MKKRFKEPDVPGTPDLKRETERLRNICQRWDSDYSLYELFEDFCGQQAVVELKIWRGNEYLDYYHLEKGYMVSFNFNKKKEIGVKELSVGGKTIVEAVV